MVLACAASMQAVQLKVAVPAGTPSCYVVGAFNNWNVGEAIALSSAGGDTFEIDLPEVSVSQMQEGYKYVCGRDWKYVEKGEGGAEISNRTSIGNPDRVVTWAALYNPYLIEQTVRINGYDRKVRILLPDGYAESDKSYPVIYYLGVNQRYSEAGGDNPGDDFFGSQSWNAGTVARSASASGQGEAILVSTPCFVAEAIPYAHPDFMGSGQADGYLDDWFPGVVEYVKSNYRTVTAPESNTVMGADLGGLLALYAGVSRPDIFGTVLSMSPMVGLNAGELTGLVDKLDSGQRIILTSGSAEPENFRFYIRDLAESLGEVADYREFTGGLHNDKSWAEEFASLYPVLTGTASEPVMRPVTEIMTRRVAPVSSVSGNCSFYYTESGSTPVLDTSVEFIPTSNYTTKSGDQKDALVLVKPISKSFKGTCYWNVKDNDADCMLLSTNGNVKFSSKKTAESWVRIAVFEDGTVEHCSASSIGFTLKTSSETVEMTPGPDYTATCTISFPGDDKSFAVHYGSVNSQSDMGAVTGTLEASSYCLKAEVKYNFLDNTVEVNEIVTGEPLAKLYVSQFSAVPSVTKEGESSQIVVKLTDGYTPSLTMTVNYGSPRAIPMTAVGAGEWCADLSNLSAGIYHLDLTATPSQGVSLEAGRIAVKVTPGALSFTNPAVKINAYEDVDWNTTGRFKANFHTHTSQSFDTQFTTDVVVDRYQNAGYSILALTDHDSNPYPWQLFDLYNPLAKSRDPEAMGMLAVPGVELSKDNRNSWDEASGGSFNHHNDFFTGRKGQEFASLQESYEYTRKLGGMQIINHPGQYWNLSTSYAAGSKNSPEWHAGNFMNYESLVGLEVYNQGNRRPNDRILWDQILEITMPDRPVWGYSGDDTHTIEQYFRNYNIMLMPSLTVDDLKVAMKNGAEYFSYEYTGSGEAKAPAIQSISVDNIAKTITIDTDADAVYWIYSTDKPSDQSSSARQSTVVGMGPVFDFHKYQGRYVRALLKNDYGETCTQPFGFGEYSVMTTVSAPVKDDTAEFAISLSENPAHGIVTVKATCEADTVRIYSLDGRLVSIEAFAGSEACVDISNLSAGNYIVVAERHGMAASCRLTVN